MEKVKNMLKNYAVDAILLIILGMVMFFGAKKSLSVIFILLGSVLIIMGLVKGILFLLKKEEQGILSLTVGIIQVVAGIFVLAKKGLLVDFFPVVSSLILVYGAVIMLIRAVKLRHQEKKIFLSSLVLGIITLLLAIMIFLHPVVIADVMIQAAGISLVVEGVALLIVLSRRIDTE